MRFQAAGDIRLEIDDYLASSDERNVGPRSSARSILQPWPWAVAGLLVAGLVLALWRPWFASAPAALPMRLDIRVADGEPLIFDENRDSALAMISPDGQSLVYRGTRDGIGRLYVRSLNSGQSRPLAGTEAALAHFFSPDGRWVAFFASGMLNKVALTGGAPMQLCSAPRGKGGAWSDDDTIVFTPDTDTGLFLVSAAGGSPVQVTKPADGERTHRWPTFLPGGKAVVFMRQNKDAAYDDGLIEAVRLDTGERKVLVRGGTFPRYLASGHLAYMREGTLFVVPMNPDRLELQGGAVPVLAEILSSGGVGSVSGDGAGQISFSTNGTAVYVPGSWSGAAAALEIVDRTGKTIYTYHEPHDFRSPRFSPDGTRIAVLMGDANGRHVHVVDPARGTASRVTFDGTDNGVPVWTPDGKRLAYWSDRASSTGNIFLTRSDGSGEPERLTSAPYVQVPSSFSSDGHLLRAWKP
jgi:hypothetical protein